VNEPTVFHGGNVTVEPVQPTVKAAKKAGSLYLLLIVTSLLAFIYTGALIVSGDATATEAKQVEGVSAPIFRLGF
jgi:hypothetical protein